MKTAGLTPDICAYYRDWPLTDEAATEMATE